MAEGLAKGSCLCGAVTFEAKGQPKFVAHCHCPSCRKATGAAFATFAGFPGDKVTIAGESLVRRESSPGVTRSFCGHCGSPMAYESEAWAGEVHLLVALFDDPEAFPPKAHVHVKTRLEWLHIADGLPQLEGFG